MSVILRNEFGAVAVNKGVIERMIIEDLLEMSDSVILCNKKGKIIRDKATRLMEPDHLDAIEVYEKKKVVRVKVYLISIFGFSITKMADEIFECVERDFEMLKLPKPGVISVNVKGIMMQKQLIKRNIEVVRKNA